MTVDRPWAYGLSRLLTARPGLKKGDIAAQAGIKGGTISGLLNSPKPPHVLTLQKVADAITELDRRSNPSAPAVGLWEFFVSDEQARILRDAAAAQAKAVQQTDAVAQLAQLLQNPHVVDALHRLTSPPVVVEPGRSTQTDQGVARSEDQPADGTLRRPRSKKAS